MDPRSFYSEMAGFDYLQISLALYFMAVNGGGGVRICILCGVCE